MSKISATFSNFVDSAEKIYTLAMRIKDDLTKYSQKKEKEKIKLQIEKLRDLVGTIDSMNTKLYVRLENMGFSMFEKHKNEFEMLFNNIERLSSEIYVLMDHPYFHQFPVLRERLYVKSYLDIEGPPRNSYWGEYEDEPETKGVAGAPKLLTPVEHSYPGPVKDYASFAYYMRETHYVTRATLDALNYHLEKYFSN